MRCIVDLRNAASRIGTVRGRTVFWSSVPDHRKGFLALARALRAIAGGASVTHVGITVQRPDPEVPRFATWSVMRGAAAIGNSLAFAFNARVAEIPVAGDETDEDILRTFSAACAGTRTTEWSVPAYGGEPNITKPKGVGQWESGKVGK